MMRFLRNLGLSFTSKVVTTAFNVAFLAAVARLFRKEEVAVLALAAIAAMLMDVAKGFGLGTVVLKRLPKYERSSPEAASLVASFLVFSLAVPAGLAVLGALAAAGISQQVLSTPSYAAHLRLGLAAGVFQAVANSGLLVLQAQQKFGLLAVGSLVSSFAFRLAPCLCAILAGLSFYEFLEWSLALAAAGCLGTLLPLAPLLRTKGVRLLRRSEYWDESRYFYLTRLLRYGSTQMDQLIVAALFSPVVLAVYYMLRRLFSAAITLIDSLVDTLVPDVSRHAGLDGEAARGRLQNWVGRALLLGAVGGAFLAVNGRLTLRLILGPDYVADNVLVLLFAVSALTYFVYSLAQVDLVLFHPPRRLLALAGAAAATNIAAGLALAPLAGVHGLPVAMSLSHMAGLELARRGGALCWRPRLLAGSVCLVAAAGLGSPWASGPGVAWLQMGLANLVVGAAALTLMERERGILAASVRRFTR